MSVTILGKYPHRHDNGHQPGLYPPSQVNPRNTPRLARRTPVQLYHWENHTCEKYLILKSYNSYMINEQ